MRTEEGEKEWGHDEEVRGRENEQEGWRKERESA